MQDENAIAEMEPGSESPALSEVEGSSLAARLRPGAPLTETLESTGEEGVLPHGPLAKGSGDGSRLGAADEVAATLAASNSAASSREDGAHSSASGDATPRVRPGAQLGRLEIGETLGSGAFGVVVSAFDPELKRKLAVKILRPEIFESAGGKDAQKRLLREARAMARISHPNVVTVHDIGMVEGQVYVAMEFVDGTHLRAWLSEQDRSWHEILDVFGQAGCGLAAAHQEGLVHRDFKPDNVLVSDKGLVRVADFGLVSIKSQNREKIRSTEFVAPRGDSDELGITRAGAVMGTALYMAPEQHRGHDAGPSADQFAFCVALYWALYEQLPFDGENYQELRDNVLAGALKPPPPGTKRPRWLWPILAKGMAQDPASRHESMEELLRLLSQEPARRRNGRLKYAAVALVGAGAIGGFFITRSDAGAVCQNTEKRLEGTWDAEARARVRATYEGAGRANEFARLESAVDSYTTQWVSVRTRVCEATHLVGDQSDSLMDLRMSCLDQRLGYLGQLIGQIDARSDGPLLDKALTASKQLPSLDACTQGSDVANEIPLPTDAEERRKVLATQSAVDRAQAMSDLGRAAEAAAILRKVLEAPVDFPRVMGEVTHLLGTSLSDLGELDEAEAMLNRSIEYATQAGDDLSVASSWLALMHIAGVEREEYAVGHERVRMARLAMARGKADPFTLSGADRSTAILLLREGKAKEAIELLEPLLPIYRDAADDLRLASLLSVLADAKAGDSRHEEAIADYRLSLAHLESALGPEHLENVYTLNNLAVALKNAGELDDAREVLERSLAIVERTYGKTHRNVVTILINLGNLARRQGDLVSAREIFERAIAVGNEVLEDGHPNVTKAIMNLGIVLAAEKKYEEATTKFLVVLERAKKSFDEDHPDLAMALNNVGESLSLEEKYEEGLAYVTEAMAMKARLYGPDHPKCASSIAAVGSIQAKLGNIEQAERHLEKALTIYLQAVGESHPLTIKMLSELGALHLQANDHGSAIRFFRRAIAARGESKSVEQGQDRLGLARALWASSNRKAAASEEASVESILEALENGADLRLALETWRNDRQ